MVVFVYRGFIETYLGRKFALDHCQTLMYLFVDEDVA